MSIHPRSAIRNAVAALLSTPVESVYPTPCQDRVFVNRNRPVFPAKLPAILVYVKNDRPVKTLMSARYRAWHDLTVVVEAAVKEEDLDDNLDLISGPVEELLMGSPTLGLDFVTGIKLGETDITTRDQAGGEHPIGSIRTAFLVRYERTIEEAGAADQPVLEEIHNFLAADRQPTVEDSDLAAVAVLEGED